MCGKKRKMCHKCELEPVLWTLACHSETHKKVIIDTEGLLFSEPQRRCGGILGCFVSIFHPWRFLSSTRGTDPKGFVVMLVSGVTLVFPRVVTCLAEGCRDNYQNTTYLKLHWSIYFCINNNSNEYDVTGLDSKQWTLQFSSALRRFLASFSLLFWFPGTWCMDWICK